MNCAPTYEYTIDAGARFIAPWCGAIDDDVTDEAPGTAQN